MASNQIVLVKDVKPRKKNTRLRVKIATLWRKKMNGCENKTYRVDMILMDEMGDLIYANCMHTMLERFDSMLNVDEKIYLNNPLISKDDAKQHIDNDKKLSFNDKTTIMKCLNWEGPNFAFNFVSFKTILQEKLKHNTKLDFLGYVKVCYNLAYVDKKNGLKSPKINFKLRDLDGTKIDGSLWEDKAIALSSFMSNPERDRHVFLLVQFGQVNNYQGKMSVTNSYEAARVFINEDIEELTAFKNAYLEKFVEKQSSQSSNTSVGTYMISNVEDEFLNNSRFIVTAFIPTIKTESRVIIVGKISEIGTDLQWYYRGCNYCKAKVEQKFVSYERDDGTIGGKEVFKCSSLKCEDLEIKEVIRYRISLKVDDGCGSIKMTLFDYEACKIFGKPARYFVEQEEEMINNDQVPPSYPKEFEEIVGKKYAFIIKVTPYNIDHPDSQYGISMLTKDEGLLAAISKKWKVEEVQARYSVDENGIVELEDDNEEDRLSSTNANESQMSTRKKVADEDGPSTKRTVEDVYEVEEPSKTSISKRKKLILEDD